MAKTALGLDRNISALVAYVLGWVSGQARSGNAGSRC